MKHINEIKFEGEDRWTKQFNLCSDLYCKHSDMSLSEDEREDALNLWIEERQRLELGIY
jgi:hypothetical protein